MLQIADSMKADMMSAVQICFVRILIIKTKCSVFGIKGYILQKMICLMVKKSKKINQVEALI